MTDPREHSKPGAAGWYLPLASGIAIFVPVIIASNQLGGLLRFPALGSAVLYLPYAVLTAALIASARRHWKWYVLVAVLAHAVTSLARWPVSWVLVAGTANIVRALIAAGALRYLLGSLPRLDSLRSLAQYIAIAVIGAPAIGASIGASNALWHVQASGYWRTWSAWFLSNALTAMIALPGLIVLTELATTPRMAPLDRRRIIEALSLTVALCLTCTTAFVFHVVRPGDLTLLLYAPSPLLIWAALRFGHGGASLALTAVAGSAIWGANRATDEFLSLLPDDTTLSLQLFMALTALPILCVATIGAAGRASAQVHRSLLASLHDHVAILDASGIVLDVSQSWQRYALEDHGCPVDRIRAGDDFLAACRLATQLPDPEGARAARALAGVEGVLAGKNRRFEMEYEANDGEVSQWFTVRIEALERAEGGVVVTRADVSLRHRAQLEVEEHRREVMHLARIGVLGQLSGALAHELRQPLASILANAESAQQLMKRNPLDRDEMSAILEEIRTEDLQAANVIDSLRTLLKRGEARVGAVETESLVHAVLAMARPELVTRGIVVTASVQRELPPLHADAVQVQQVLLNLILNACEAMSDTPMRSRSLLLTAAASGERHVRMSVRDSGVGIPPALIARLFEPFMSTKSQGLGLGLSIAQTIVASHGGRIWAENNADRGATLHCEFPAVVPRQLAAASRSLATA